mmetsp:Transcript_47578/g.98673  ORF Transcript_47578/g.98673 Transcript_47578/m.98673 type:complete len:100 (+) Transcript_47578:1526-1825(+)
MDGTLVCGSLSNRVALQDTIEVDLAGGVRIAVFLHLVNSRNLSGAGSHRGNLTDSRTTTKERKIYEAYETGFETINLTTLQTQHVHSFCFLTSFLYSMP